jgi:hypothetical protein
MSNDLIVKIINGVPTGTSTFCGNVSKDYDPVGTNYAVGYTVMQTYDSGAHGMLVPVLVSIPAKIGNVSGVVAYMFSDVTETLDENTSGVALVRRQQDILEILLGSDIQSATNNGKTLQKIELRVRNAAGGPETQDLAAFRVRALSYIRQTGTAL